MAQHRAKMISPEKGIPKLSVRDNGGLFSSPKRDPNMRDDYEQKKEQKSPAYGPFKPNNPAKQGYNKTINPFPDYKE